MEVSRMDLYDGIIRGEEKISLVGLGYVGMPIAIAFAERIKVIGFDISEEKITQYKNGIDPTKEVGNRIISETRVEFTSDELKLKEAKFHVVAVPTPLLRVTIHQIWDLLFLQVKLLVGI